MVTLTLQVDEVLLKRLEAEAHDKQISVEEVAIAKLGAKDAELIESTRAKSSEPIDERHDPDDVLLHILAGADELGERSTETNVSERSREILSTDFAEYLMRKTRGQL